MSMSILIVDDDKKLLNVLASVLEIKGYNVTSVQSGSAALHELSSGTFDLVLADLRMPHMNGIQLLKKVAMNRPMPKVVLMTAYATAETASKARELGVFEYLEKPFKLTRLGQVLDRAAQG